MLSYLANAAIFLSHAMWIETGEDCYQNSRVSRRVVIVFISSLQTKPSKKVDPIKHDLSRRMRYLEHLVHLSFYIINGYLYIYVFNMNLS